MPAYEAMTVRCRRAAPRRTGRAAVFALLLGAAGMLVAASARAGERPGRRGFWMPGAFLSVQTRSAADVLEAVSEMVDAVRPGTGEKLRALLAGGLQIGGADGLDLIGGERPAGLLVLNPRRHEGHIVVAVGDAGLQGVFRALGRAMGQEVDDDLIEFGDFVIGEGDSALYFRHVEPWLLCSLDATPLDAAAKAIKKGRVPRAPKRRAHVAAHLDMKELRAAYGDVVAGGFQIGRTAMAAAAMQQGPGNPMGQFGAGIFKEYINAGEAIFEGFDEVDVAIKLSGKAAEIELSMLPSEEGVFAPLARVTEPATFAPASALPGGGTFAGAWRTDPVAAERLIDAFARAAARISMNKDTLDEEDEETREKLARYRRLIGGFLAGEGASSVVMSDKGMGSVMAMEADFGLVRDLYTEMLDIFAAEMAPLFEGLGLGMEMNYEKDVRTLAGGGRVDRMATTYEFDGVMAEQMKGVFDMLVGGDRQVVEIGDAGTATIAAWDRDDPAKALDEAVERLKRPRDFAEAAWPDASRELVRALDKARGVVTMAFEVRMGGYMAMVISMMKARPGMGDVFQFDEEDVAKLTKKDVPVVGWAGAEDGRLLLYERIPTASVKNVADFLEKMQKRMMERMGPMGGDRDDWEEPEPGPEDPAEVW